jgi:anti-sigma regulatory factor (Ser/Thr protein kinase)
MHPISTGADRTQLVHDALIFQSDAEFVAALTPFTLDGLNAGEKACAIATPRNLELLHSALGPRATDLEMIETTEFTNRPARAIAAYHSKVASALKAGAPRVRVISEVEFGITDIERAERSRYESVLNHAFQGYPAWITCLYDTRRLPEHVVASARQTHSHALHQGERIATEQFVDPASFAASLPIAIPDRFLGQIELTGELTAVLDLVRQTCAQAGLSTDQTVDLCLVVGELATNAIEHGAPPARVAAWQDDRTLVYEITDSGPGPLDPWLGFVPPQPLQPRGRGLWLSRQLADRVEIEASPAGTTARVEVRIGS